MSEDEQIDQIINQTLEGAFAMIPSYLSEVELSKDDLKVSDPKEFVYGMIMGMSLGMASAAVATIRQAMPSEADQIKIRDMVYSKIPIVRERIFG